MNTQSNITLNRGDAVKLLKIMDANKSTETPSGFRIREKLRELLADKSARTICITAKGKGALDLFQLGLKYVCS